MKKKKKSSNEETTFTRTPARSGGFGAVKGNSNNKLPRAEELVDIQKLSKKFLEVRFLGPVAGSMVHWIDIETPKGIISIPKAVPNYDVETDSIDNSIQDPYASIKNEKRTQKHYYVNAIIRDLQEDEPRKKPELTPNEKKTGMKDPGSKAWTPVRVIRITPSIADKLGKLREINIHKINGRKEAFDITDDKYGCDIFMSFDNDKSPADKYQLQKAEASPLTKEERGYLLYDVDSIHRQITESMEDAIREAEKLNEKSPDIDDSDEDDDDLNQSSFTKKKKSDDSVKKKKKKKSDEDDLPKKKKKKSDEDDLPKKKKKKK